MSRHPLSLTELFLNYFNVEPVTSETQQSRAGRVRYRVYCEEFGFEPAERFRDGCENDPYDDYSLQCLITHRRSHRAAGCVRIICPSQEQSMAFEDHCLESIHVHHLQALSENRDGYCEVSRLAVDADFRRAPAGAAVTHEAFADCCRTERRTFSLVGMAALLSVFAMASHSGRNDIFAMMEPGLPRLLRQMGIVPEQAGDPIEYHGQRTPYFITTATAVESMRDELRALYESIFLQVAGGFGAQESVA